MERIEGVVIREQLPPEFDAWPDRKKIGEELIDASSSCMLLIGKKRHSSNLVNPKAFLNDNCDGGWVS